MLQRRESRSPLQETSKWNTADLVTEYLAELDQPSKSEQTLDRMTRDLWPFATAVTTLPCSRADINGFLNHPERSHLHTNTRNLLFRHVRTFLYWCEDIHEIEPPKFRRLAPPTEETEQDPLTEAEVRAVLAASREPDYRHPYMFQNETMFELMLSTGLRAGGVATLTPDRVFPDHIVTTEKTGKGEYGITEDLYRKLVETNRRTPGPFVFCNDKGRPMNTSSVRNRVYKMLKRCGIKKLHQGAHLLRHTVGTFIYEQSGDLKLVQQQLGHKTLTMANRYATMSDARKRLGVERYNPVAVVAGNGGG